MQPPFPSRLSGVIFDMDGTLTKTSELIFACFNHVAEKYLGKTLSPAEIIGLFGPPEEGGLQRMLGRGDVDDALEDLYSFYCNRHSSMASLHPRIDEILTFLDERGIRLAIFTGKGSTTTEITLREFGIARYFDLIISGSDVAQHKPDPEGIRRILAALTLPPSEVLMVGDSLSDLRASRAAGVPFASVLWDSYDHEHVLAAGGEYFFEQPDEFLDWLRGQVQ